jgi:hypothetical protein
VVVGVVCACVCVCVCVCACVRVCVCVCIYTYKYTFVCVCVCVATRLSHRVVGRGKVHKSKAARDSVRDSQPAKRHCAKASAQAEHCEIGGLKSTTRPRQKRTVCATFRHLCRPAMLRKCFGRRSTKSVRDCSASKVCYLSGKLRTPRRIGRCSQQGNQYQYNTLTLTLFSLHRHTAKRTTSSLRMSIQSTRMERPPTTFAESFVLASEACERVAYSTQLTRQW